MPGMEVHWGLAAGVVACVISWVLIEKTRWGFAARIAGGNVRAAQVQGLAVGPLIVGFTALAGGFAGLAGMIEVAAVQGNANGSLAAGYGYTGILVAFLARHNPLAIIPVAILLGGIDASGGLLQRRMDLPDATVQVLQGMIFIVILFSETFYGRFRIFNPDLWKRERLMETTDIGLWGVPLAILGGAIRVSTPFIFVSLGRNDHGALRPHQSWPRRHFGVRRDDRLCGCRHDRIRPGLGCSLPRPRERASACSMAGSANFPKSTTSPSASR